jgi:hypothetical protein
VVDLFYKEHLQHLQLGKGVFVSIIGNNAWDVSRPEVNRGQLETCHLFF